MIKRGDVVELEPQSDVSEPDAFEEQEFHATPLARPWPRYWARMLDLIIGVTILSFMVGYLKPSWLSSSGDDRLLVLALVPFVLIIEAIVIAIFGTTVGKALAGVRVETVDHQKLSPIAALVRAIRVYVFGLALVIPIVCLMTFWRNFRTLNDGELASWDEDCETRVFDVGSTGLRTWITAILYLSILVGSIFMNQRAKEMTGPQAYVAAMPIMNEGLPKKIDSVTRLDHIGVEHSSLVYNFTLINADGSTMSADRNNDVVSKQAALRDQAKIGACKMPANSPLLNGMGMEYRYYTESGIVVDFTIHRDDC